MIRDNRILSTLVLLGLLMPGLDPAARAQPGDGKTFTVSGNAGVPGVVLQGLPGRPVTDSQGHYSVKVEHGWAGGVVPFNEGYAFTPQARQYNAVTTDQNNQDFVAELRMITITDVVTFGGKPAEGVIVTAQPGGHTATTDSSGRYNIKVPYGWSGSLSMSKPGFDIDSSGIWYTNVTSPIIDGRRAPSPADMRARMRSPSSPAAVPNATSEVLVIPTADVTPEKIGEMTDDMRVMLHILREKLSEPRMILGMLRDYGSFFGDDRKAEAFYLQGTAAVFVIRVDFPYSFPTRRPDEGEGREEAVDPIWQRARERLYSPAGPRGYGQSVQARETTFEQFKDELLRSLRHAANVRHIEPNELVILTVVAQNEDAGWPGAASGGSYSTTGGGWVMGGVSGSGGGSFSYGGTSSYANSRTFSGGGRDRTDAPVTGAPAGASTTVLTMQAKKADVDAFAKGEIDFEQFRQKVRSFTY
jgi:hypothetical protein